VTAATRPKTVSDPVASRSVGWIAVAATLAIAFGLALLRARSDTPPSMPAAGLVGFFAAFAGPGLVAAVGLARRRSQLLVGAAIVLICLAPLSMAGATLPLLIPAVILIYVAGRLPASGEPAGLRVATAIVTIGLLVAGPVALFTTTEIVCWEDYGGGRIDVRVVQEMPNEQSSPALLGSGCASGSISALGGSLAILAVAGAVTIAAGSGRRPHSPPIVALSDRNNP
jgi:hypothetical protein